MPYLYIPVAVKNKYQTNYELNLSNYPNAGPNPCIAGMRNLYWGKDAYVIKSGKYAYKVSQEIFEKFVTIKEGR